MTSQPVTANTTLILCGHCPAEAIAAAERERIARLAEQRQAWYGPWAKRAPFADLLRQPIPTEGDPS